MHCLIQNSTKFGLTKCWTISFDTVEILILFIGESLHHKRTFLSEIGMPT